MCTSPRAAMATAAAAPLDGSSRRMACSPLMLMPPAPLPPLALTAALADLQPSLGLPGSCHALGILSLLTVCPPCCSKLLVANSSSEAPPAAAAAATAAATPRTCCCWTCSVLAVAPAAVRRWLRPASRSSNASRKLCKAPKADIGIHHRVLRNRNGLFEAWWSLIGLLQSSLNTLPHARDAVQLWLSVNSARVESQSV